jgi:hypothetical protein
MSAKTVTIDHPHAEVIAAYYSGKTVQVRGFNDEWHDWRMPLDCDDDAPAFFSKNEWRIKPEPIVKWAVAFPTGSLWGVYESREFAEREILGHELAHARIVRMVEQPE